MNLIRWIISLLIASLLIMLFFRFSLFALNTIIIVSLILILVDVFMNKRRYH